MDSIEYERPDDALKIARALVTWIGKEYQREKAEETGATAAPDIPFHLRVRCYQYDLRTI